MTPDQTSQPSDSQPELEIAREGKIDRVTMLVMVRKALRDIPGTILLRPPTLQPSIHPDVAIPDIVGTRAKQDAYMPLAVPFAVTVVPKGTKLLKTQDDALAELRLAGWATAIVQDVQDALDFLKRHTGEI